MESPPLEWGRGRTGELAELLSRSNNVKFLPLPPPKGDIDGVLL
jgi:hypothetical protein